MRRIFNTGLLLLVSIAMVACFKKEDALPDVPKKSVVQLVNILADNGSAEAQFNDSLVLEQAVNVLDNDASAKFLTFNASSWVQLKSF